MISCTRTNPTRKCAAREYNQRRGTFWYSFEARSWLWSGAMDVLDGWDFCPWCGGELPTMVDAVKRLLDAKDERWEGEDGG